MNPALSVEHLSRSFIAKRNLLGRAVTRVRAVRDVSFQLQAGETLALVGESGAGKSTVARLVLRLIEPDAGTIRLLGRDLRACSRKELTKLRARARIVFQDPFSSLDPRMSIRQVLAEPLSFHLGMSRSERPDAIRELLTRVGLDASYSDRYPYELSGGQLQRVAVARAIATKPDLIVCDEPVSALDMSIRAQVINLLRRLQAELGIAYLFISHDLMLVRGIADRVAVMRGGQIVETSDPRTLFERPRHPYTRALLEAIPIPDPSRRARE